MVIKEEGSEIFDATMARYWKKVMELWAKNKIKKHASSVASNLTAWSCKPHGKIFLTSFSSEDQKVLLENEVEW